MFQKLKNSWILSHSTPTLHFFQRSLQEYQPVQEEEQQDQPQQQGKQQQHQQKPKQQLTQGNNINLNVTARNPILVNSKGID